MMRSDLQDLAQRIAEMERNEHPCRRLASLVGMPAWEEDLLGGKLAAGSLVELLAAEEGAGAWTLALFMARHACGERKVLVIADLERRFYPPAASRLSIDLRRTIVVRPKPGQPALTAMTQSLRCAAVGAALAKLDRLSSTDCRRLQVAAECGGGVGFLLRSAAALNMPSFATVRLLIAPFVGPVGNSVGAAGSLVRRIQVEVVRFRGSRVDHGAGHGGSRADHGGLTRRRSLVILEIDDEKGHVRVPASMAVAKPLAVPAGASG